jgi:outer membrane protein TolC
MKGGVLIILFICVFVKIGTARNIDSIQVKLTLDECINYALKNQPSIQQAFIDELITEENIKISLSGWLPQIDLNTNLQHYLKLPVAFFPDPANPAGPKQRVSTGLVNTSGLLFSANQTLYSTVLFFAKKTARHLRELASENTGSTQINLVVDVSKAFYDVLINQQQLLVFDEDIIRLEKNYSDSYSLYKNGLTAKTDYQRAIISLNNARAQRYSILEGIKTKKAYLKQLIGLPSEVRLNIEFDYLKVQNELSLDTLRLMDYEKRIEYQTLQTNISIQQYSASYFRWSFLPTLSAYADYNIIFQNDNLSKLYSQAFPNSYVGLKIDVPIFHGKERIHNLRKANLLSERLNLNMTNLKNQINTEYVQALSSYKSNLGEMNAAKENISIARDIFDIVRLQYSNGIVTYLEVIVAETDLRTAQLNYLNTLYQVLSSIMDVKKALGDIVVR